MIVSRVHGNDVLEVVPAILLQPHVTKMLDARYMSFAGLYRLCNSVLLGDIVLLAGKDDQGWVGLIELVRTSPDSADIHIAWARGKSALDGVEQAKPLALAEGLTKWRAFIPAFNRATNLLARRSGFSCIGVSEPCFLRMDGVMERCNHWVLEN